MRVIHTIRSHFLFRQWRQARLVVTVSVLVIAGGFAALGLMGPGSTSTPAQSGAGPEFETVPTAPVTYVQRLTRSGTVSTAPQIPVTPGQPAYIRQITVAPGQSVGRGQVIAVLQPANDSANRAQAAYQTAQENLAQARGAFADARMAMDARVGDVETQTAAVAAAKAGISSAQTAYKAAQTALTEAGQRVRQRTAAASESQTLYRQGVIPRSELQQAQAALSQATSSQRQAGTDLADAEGELANATENLQNSQRSLAQAQAAQAAARRAYNDAQANVRRQQDAANRAQAAARAVRLVPLQSPVEGVVDTVLVQPGVLVTPTTQVARITPSDISVVEMLVTDEEASQILAGTPVVVTPKGLSTTLTGRVQGVYPTANGGEARNRVIVEAMDSAQTLKPGAKVSVEMPLSQISAVTVPRTALRLVGVRPSVRVLENGTAKTRLVTVVGYEGEAAIISEGLRVGERVFVASEPLGERPAPVIP